MIRRSVPWLILLFCAACGTPSRRLPTRMVDDPMVLPRRMALAAMTGVIGERPRPHLAWNAIPRFDYGLTDRLELDNLLALRWAVLDDAPLPEYEQRRPDPLSLALRGGLFGLGYSSTSGWIVAPMVGAEVLRHVGTQTFVALSASWQGQWSERAYGLRGYLFADDLHLGGTRFSAVALDASALRQLSDHVAFQLGVTVHQLGECIFPSCAWATRDASVWMAPRVRPWHWLTLSLEVLAGGRRRALQGLVTTPDAPIAASPRTVSWLETAATASFHW
jgi:hypothetical protein